MVVSGINNPVNFKGYRLKIDVPNKINLDKLNRELSIDDFEKTSPKEDEKIINEVLNSNIGKNMHMADKSRFPDVLFLSNDDYSLYIEKNAKMKGKSLGECIYIKFGKYNEKTYDLIESTHHMIPINNEQLKLLKNKLETKMLKAISSWNS